MADPLGGSALVEAWTDEIRARARALIAKIDGLGGAVAAIESGFLAREIEDAAFAAQKEIEDGRRIVVGVNAYREDEAEPPTLLSVDPSIEREQVGRLAAFRAARDPTKAREALARVARDAVGRPQSHAGDRRGRRIRSDARRDRLGPEDRLRRAPPWRLTGA